jgi:hypothetical protein
MSKFAVPTIPYFFNQSTMINYTAHCVISSPSSLIASFHPYSNFAVYNHTQYRLETHYNIFFRFAFYFFMKIKLNAFFKEAIPLRIVN